jgi:hypothetical protein
LPGAGQVRRTALLGRQQLKEVDVAVISSTLERSPQRSSANADASG